MKINYQPDVFDDPEFCNSDYYGKYCQFHCDIEQSHCGESDSNCVLFVSEVHSEDGSRFKKCLECKKYYQEAKNKTNDDVENFICMLINNHEGDIITEEYLHMRYADFLKGKQ